MAVSVGGAGHVSHAVVGVGGSVPVSVGLGDGLACPVDGVVGLVPASVGLALQDP